MAGPRSLYRQSKKSFKLFWAVNWWKTIYFNYKMFPFEVALKLPVIFYGSVKFRDLSGTLKIEAPIRKGMVGFGQPYEFFSREKGIAEIALRGKIVFKGYVQFGKDYQILVDTDAYLEMGHMASLASSGRIICKEQIVFGNYARIGSECQLMDTNFHQMLHTETGEKYPITGAIVLGNYNFVSNRVTFMQGTVTPDYCTIASNTLCNKDYSLQGENILIGGIPAKLLKTQISRDWEGEEALLNTYLKLYGNGVAMGKNKRYIYILLGALSLLLIPLIAMLFTTEVDWSLLDFIVMGVLLLSIGSLVEIVLRKVHKKGLRIVWIIFLFLLFLLIWVELAVGIFGTPLAGS